MLWQKLLDAYIIPNGPQGSQSPMRRSRSFRLPSLQNHRSHQSRRSSSLPLRSSYELMDESVLVPFLNSVAYSSARIVDACGGSDEMMGDQNGCSHTMSTSFSPSRTRDSRETIALHLAGQAADALSPLQRPLARASHQSHLVPTWPSLDCRLFASSDLCHLLGTEGNG